MNNIIQVLLLIPFIMFIIYNIFEIYTTYKFYKRMKIHNQSFIDFLFEGDVEELVGEE